MARVFCFCNLTRLPFVLPAIRCISKDDLMNSFRLLAVAASLSTMLLSGCRIVDHKDGKNDNVDISTPFGSMSVKSNDNADASAIGLTVYPGASPVKDKGDDKNNADVNMSFGDFHLGVKAASFQTSDSIDQVIAFYRKDLGKYGDVIECKGDNAIGTPTRTSQGLTCNDKDAHGHVHGSVNVDSEDEIELKAGSQTRVHVVGIKEKDGGTRIGLVMLNLPSQLHPRDSKDTE